MRDLQIFKTDSCFSSECIFLLDVGYETFYKGNCSHKSFNNSLALEEIYKLTQGQALYHFL